MYFYVEYARIFSDFSKAIILLKKIIYEKISFLGGAGRGGGSGSHHFACLNTCQNFSDFQEGCLFHYYNGGTLCGGFLIIVNKSLHFVATVSPYTISARGQSDSNKRAILCDSLILLAVGLRPGTIWPRSTSSAPAPVRTCMPY